MAFPATYNFSYYKGDTLEFNIYPKKADGTVFDLSPFLPSYDNDNNQSTPNIVYDTSKFVFSLSRGSSGTSSQVTCFSKISNDATHILCAIRPADSVSMVAGTQYVYDVQVSTNTSSNGYPIVHTLLTGVITVTDQVATGYGTPN
jgi:hypothetical protein